MTLLCYGVTLKEPFEDLCGHEEMRTIQQQLSDGLLHSSNDWCKENILYTITPLPPAWTIDTRQD